ncbi:DUF6144 family protein [Anaerolentibacter hominis]|uniref:DUF6144 family protein n=1 Tax=Anaerolentibacter hominis TaxID=3079009 RepID=UPI0031B878AA
MFDIRKIQATVIYEAVKAESDADTAKEVVYGECKQALEEDDAAWVNSTMHRLESKFDPEAVRRIRMNCQCGYGMDEKLALLKELMESAGSLEDMVNSDKAKAAGLFCRDGELYLQFLFCPCPMIAEVERLETNTWCQCTAGYSKVLFEKAFGCEVDVELLKSIKTGDDICLMRIIPRNLIWKKQ